MSVLSETAQTYIAAGFAVLCAAYLILRIKRMFLSTSQPGCGSCSGCSKSIAKGQPLISADSLRQKKNR